MKKVVVVIGDCPESEARATVDKYIAQSARSFSFAPEVKYLSAMQFTQICLRALGKKGFPRVDDGIIPLSEFAPGKVTIIGLIIADQDADDAFRHFNARIDWYHMPPFVARRGPDQEFVIEYANA